MDPQTGQQSVAKSLTLSMIAGLGVAILSLVVGTILDYIVVQVLSQYFISGCSEDCYFAYFNSIFYVVAFLSLVAGILAGRKTYTRFSQRSQ